ncbi:MAG TPA: DUF1015 domain-containing protein [bacterium]|jgi:uncharacterized protein (DUF1015 family)|nr:DUF1015 domain-containing protein [bacterium]
MAQISAFRALRYSPSKIKDKDLGKVVAPPYDIISPAEQDAYYALHPFNVIRLDFGKTQAGDDAQRNKYRRAATLLKLWREQGVLKSDPKPALYLATQTYTAPDGRKRSFAGVYAQLKLEEYKKGVVRPHEKTLSKPKADRLELTRATHTNFSPIFFLYDDAKEAGLRWMAAQMKRKPTASFRVASGERHQLWVVDQPAAVKAFTSKLAKAPIYIADGHHRYETMLAFSKEAPASVKKEAAHTLVCLTPFQQPGLIILPTHRLVHGLKGFDAHKLLRSLAADFDVQAMPSLDALTKELAKVDAGAKKAKPAAGKKSKGKAKPAAEAHAFGLVLSGSFQLLSLKAGVDPIKAVKDKRSAAYKHLDVSLLQALVLEKILGMSPESIAAQENLFFEKDAAKTAQAVAQGRAQAAFLLNPTRMEQLQAVSDAKDVMPQKSTYFQPKLITGAILRTMS